MIQEQHVDVIENSESVDTEEDLLTSVLGALDVAKAQLCNSVNESNSSDEILELGGYIHEVEEAQEEIKEAIVA